MKYSVLIQEVHYIPVEVEAENPTEARETVANWLANEDERINFDNLIYSHTNPPAEWPVEEKQ